MKQKQKLNSPRSKVLLHCALYDDSNADAKKLEKCAFLRDTLFRLGNDALQLCITQEIFVRFPNASESEMHTQRASVLSHDVVAYIMFKAGLHRYFYDQDTISLVKFHALMEEADMNGRALWEDRGGWFLGIDEFVRRMEKNRKGATDQQQLLPKYMGIAGSRLLCQNKLEDWIVEDFNFSMKAVVGALVLAIGMDRMWSCFGPLWEERLLLSAAEIRSHCGPV